MGTGFRATERRPHGLRGRKAICRPFVKPSDGIEPSTPSWLLCYLEVRDRATIDDAALVTSCLVALGGDRGTSKRPPL